MNRIVAAALVSGAAALSLAVAVVAARPAGEPSPQRSSPVSSLKSIPIPKPQDLARYVRDEEALVVLGKALFWDVQVSSDNTVACATCHFHAGADHRPQNQLSATNGPVPVNQVLSATNVPLSRSAIDAGWRVGSAGIFPRQLSRIGENGAPDTGSDLDDREYQNVHGLNVRQVGRRNAQSVINAVYDVRHFWDGRASDTFTGRASAGEFDTRANVFLESDGALVSTRVQIDQSGLASQAVDPPLDDSEMSYRGRTWPMVGRKLLTARPLALQRVAPDDGVLGRLVNPAGLGLSPDLTYLSLVRQAFQPQYLMSQLTVEAFTQAEQNFGLFFGLAIQAYESTLVADDTPYDRYLDGRADALSDLEYEGLAFFRRRLCSTCHVDPELTLSSYRGVYGSPPYRALGPDAGFFNTGVEPVTNDDGLGGKDRFGNLLSATARRRPELAQWLRGFFKTPGLRNVEFTGPYFHTGSKTTLEDVIHFYTFAGDYSNTVLVEWGPDPRELVSMPAFLRALSDDRVRFERAPFDHPALCVSIGHVEPADPRETGRPKPGSVPDRWALVPAVGARGNPVPLQTFDELLRGIGRDGSRAHALTEPCSVR